MVGWKINGRVLDRGDEAYIEAQEPVNQNRLKAMMATGMERDGKDERHSLPPFLHLPYTTVSCLCDI